MSDVKSREVAQRPFEAYALDEPIPRRFRLMCSAPESGRVEHLNRRVQREVLGIALCRRRDLERLLCGFNAAYDGCRRRVHKGLWPEMVLRQHLEPDPAPADPACRSPDPGVIKRAFHVVADAERVSQPQTGAHDIVSSACNRDDALAEMCCGHYARYAPYDGVAFSMPCSLRQHTTFRVARGAGKHIRAGLVSYLNRPLDGAQ